MYDRTSVSENDFIRNRRWKKANNATNIYLIRYFKLSVLAEFSARRTATVSNSFCIAFSLSNITSLARFPEKNQVEKKHARNWLCDNLK